MAEGDSKYQSAIVEGKFETHTAEKLRAVVGSRLSAGLGGKTSLKPADADTSLKLHSNAAFASQRNRTLEATTTAIPAVYEVQPVPCGWRVGHTELGDPSKPSGCLDGRYFDRQVAGFPHTCEAEFREGQDRGTLTFTVTVRDGIHVERIAG
jgi:hypothetical protein